MSVTAGPSRTIRMIPIRPAMTIRRPAFRAAIRARPVLQPLRVRPASVRMIPISRIPVRAPGPLPPVQLHPEATAEPQAHRLRRYPRRRLNRLSLLLQARRRLRRNPLSLSLRRNRPSLRLHRSPQCRLSRLSLRRSPPNRMCRQNPLSHPDRRMSPHRPVQRNNKHENSTVLRGAVERVEKLDTLYKRGRPPLVISPQQPALRRGLSRSQPMHMSSVAPL